MIRELHQKLINQEITVTELTQQYLDKIKKSDLNAFITISDKEALSQAKIIDEKISAGKEISELAGIPISIKDIVLTSGIKTTAGSKILENYIAPYDATLVSKLKQVGVVILGKNNCDEFAMGGSNENSAFGLVKNPHDKIRVSGGSSGGSAAAVADDLSVFSIGTDTGGSIRQPAAFCGVVGLKPTYGSVSRYGLISMASSLDQAGPLTKTVADARIVFNAIKGKDKNDSTSVDSKSKNKKIKSLKGIKIGIPKEYFTQGLEKKIKESVNNIINKAREAGAEIIDVSLPNTEYALAVYYLIMSSEVSSNLARFDGIRYGESLTHRKKQTNTRGNADNLYEVYSKTRVEYLGEEVKRRIMLGTYALSAGYYDAYYKKAQQVRTLIKKDFEQVFSKVDILITPTTPHPAFKIGEKINDPLTMYLEDIYTVPVNIAGIPALSIPSGKTKHGLPIGTQIIGAWFEEEKILDVAEILEKMLD